MPTPTLLPFPALRRALLPLLAGISVFAFGAAAPATPLADRVFASDPIIINETKAAVQLLTNSHLNRAAVRPRDYSKAIQEYMEDLDVRRLFFLKSDLDELMERHGRDDALYFNLSRLGNVDAGYAIFTTYSRRVEERVAWIKDELAKEIDLNGSDSYVVDRSKSPFPASKAEADDLWQKRLKFEVLGEVLARKAEAQAAAGKAAATPAPEPPAAAAPAQDPVVAAKEVVSKRYSRLLSQLALTEATEVAEQFVSAVARLYDPHSSYMSWVSYQDFQIQIGLKLSGIGAVLTDIDGECVIDQLIKGGPADLSDAIEPKDKIIAVAQDGQEPVEVMDMKLSKIVQMIRGEKGTKVRLTIQPARLTDPRKEVVITRDEVKLDNQRAHAGIFDVPNETGQKIPLGVITLPTFYGDSDSPNGITATKDVAELARRLTAAGVEGIVLDLRRNGGGLLSEAIDLAGLFIRTGPVVQVKNYREEVAISDDDNPSVVYSGPLTVLVDRFSASASEIVAGALQNYGRAVVIGDSSTHGKGTVQTMAPLQPQRSIFSSTAAPQTKFGAVKLTVQKFYLPNGSSTQRDGVVPDIVLPSPYEYLSNIGEKDLPNALLHDEIRATSFEGSPLPARERNALIEASRARQAALPEFQFLARYIDWFRKDQEDSKTLSLNLAQRQKQKEDADAARKAMNAEYLELAKDKFTFREERLAPKPESNIRARDEDDDSDINLLGLDADGGYDGMDVGLRESLRVLEDVIAINRAARAAAGGAAAIAVTPPRPRSG